MIALQNYIYIRKNFINHNKPTSLILANPNIDFNRREIKQFKGMGNRTQCRALSRTIRARSMNLKLTDPAPFLVVLSTTVDPILSKTRNNPISQIPQSLKISLVRSPTERKQTYKVNPLCPYHFINT